MSSSFFIYTRLSLNSYTKLNYYNFKFVTAKNVMKADELWTLEPGDVTDQHTLAVEKSSK